MVSSGAGQLSSVREPLRGKFERLELSEDELVALMRSFPAEVAEGVHEQHGWPSSAYKVSKAGLNAYTRLLAIRLRDEPRGILINAVCPGWVRTDMGGQHATRSPEEGAKSVVWAALLASNGPSGGFFRDGRPIEW
jgi:NAD(P)-dependent dehydrogenase (short-subunit alcohol dehydrogenase family)